MTARRPSRRTSRASPPAQATLSSSPTPSTALTYASKTHLGVSFVNVWFATGLRTVRAVRDQARWLRIPRSLRNTYREYRDRDRLGRIWLWLRIRRRSTDKCPRQQRCARPVKLARRRRRRGRCRAYLRLKMLRPVELACGSSLSVIRMGSFLFVVFYAVEP